MERKEKKIKKIIYTFINKYLYLFGLLLFLFCPIIIIVVFSFSDGKNNVEFGSFTLANYEEIFQHKPFLQAISTTLYVSIISTFISVIIGSFGAYALLKVSKYIRNPINIFTQAQIVMPDLIIGLSLFLLFTLINIPLGTFSLIIAHVSFSSPYIVVIMYPRLKKLDKNQILASYDLGASKIRTFFNIVLPQIYSSLISSIIIAFVLSFDDFIISFFTSGAQNNISTFLFSLKRPTFIVNSFATLVLTIFSVFIFSSSFIKYKRDKKNEKLKNK